MENWQARCFYKYDHYFCIVDLRTQLTLGWKDKIRDEAPHVIRELKAMDLGVTMVS